jgi:hypothetical protein
MRIFLGALFIGIISGSQAHGCIVSPCPDTSIDLFRPSADQIGSWGVNAPKVEVPPPPNQQNQFIDPRCIQLTYQQIVTTPGCIVPTR